MDKTTRIPGKHANNDTLESYLPFSERYAISVDTFLARLLVTQAFSVAAMVSEGVA